MAKADRRRLALVLVIAGLVMGGCAGRMPPPSSAAAGQGTRPAASPEPATTASPTLTPTTAPASPTPTAATSASPGPSQPFSSDMYAYKLRMPAGWYPTRASSRWTSGFLEGRCPSDWDCLTDPKTTRTLAVASIDVSKNTTLADWQAQIHGSAPAVCTDSDPPTSATLGGEPALTWTSDCAEEGLQVIKLVAIHGHRGYVFLFASPSALGLDADQAALDPVLATFRFT
jgi:hypothetical protein